MREIKFRIYVNNGFDYWDGNRHDDTADETVWTDLGVDDES